MKPNISLLWWTDGVIYHGSQQSVAAWRFGKNSGLLLFIWNITLPTMKSPGKLQKVDENSKENSMCACGHVCLFVCVWDLPGSTA